LALLIPILKTAALRTGNEHYNQAARFSKDVGGAIGQTLAMEGVKPALGKRCPFSASR
jgi:hypothetical protein